MLLSAPLPCIVMSVSPDKTRIPCGYGAHANVAADGVEPYVPLPSCELKQL